MRKLIAEIQDLRKLEYKENATYRNRLGEINNSHNYTEEYKQELTDEEKKRHLNRVSGLHGDIIQNLTQIKDFINRPVNVLSEDFTNVLNVINTLGSLIGREELTTILDKFKGHEKALSILKSVCKEKDIKTTVFDDYMFSKEDNNLTLESGWTTDDYFDNIIKNMQGNDILFCSNMNKLSNKLGLDFTFEPATKDKEESKYTVAGFF